MTTKDDKKKVNGGMHATAMSKSPSFDSRPSIGEKGNIRKVGTPRDKSFSLLKPVRYKPSSSLYKNTKLLINRSIPTPDILSEIIKITDVFYIVPPPKPPGINHLVIAMDCDDMEKEECRRIHPIFQTDQYY